MKQERKKEKKKLQQKFKCILFVSTLVMKNVILHTFHLARPLGQAVSWY